MIRWRGCPNARAGRASASRLNNVAFRTPTAGAGTGRPARRTVCATPRQGLRGTQSRLGPFRGLPPAHRRPRPCPRPSPARRRRGPGPRDRSRIEPSRPLLSDRSPLLSDRSPILSDRSPILSDRSPIVSERSPILSERSAILSDRGRLVGHRSSVGHCGSVGDCALGDRSFGHRGSLRDHPGPREEASHRERGQPDDQRAQAVEVAQPLEHLPGVAAHRGTDGVDGVVPEDADGRTDREPNAGRDGDPAGGEAANPSPGPHQH